MTYRSTSIVLGYEDADRSSHALLMAWDLTARLEGHLHVVHVVTLADYPISPDGPDWETDALRRLEREKRTLNAQLSGAGIAWTYHVQPGDPAAVLGQVAHQVNALMIVIGSPTNSWASRAARIAVGTTVTRGLRRTAIPILLVPSTVADKSDPGDHAAPQDSASP